MEYIYNKGVLSAKFTECTRSVQGLYKRSTSGLQAMTKDDKKALHPIYPYPTLWVVSYI